MTHSSRSPPGLSTMKFLFGLLSFVAFGLRSAVATKFIASSSLSTCMKDSQFRASHFNILFTPGNNSLTYSFDGTSSINGNVVVTLQVVAYGFKAFEQVIDPCKENIQNLCPAKAGSITVPPGRFDTSKYAARVPGAAFSVPDIDGVARIYIKNTDTGKQVACLEAELSNGKTVHQNGASWTTAIIAGTGLVASAITSGLGHSNTAAHVAANALSLFAYFQSVAICGMVAIKLPPAVRAWAQNFAWSMGIIRMEFMQKILHWYIQSTGGTPDMLKYNLNIINVEIQKRSTILKRAIDAGSNLMKRSSPNSDIAGNMVSVTGITRMAFLADIERTNFFMTGLSFLVAFIVFVVVGVLLFKFGSEFLIHKAKVIKGSKFVEFRNGWQTVLKGILYRVALIGFPQMSIICLWELTVRDSVAAVVLALVFFFVIAGLLAWASFKVIKLAQQSIATHKSAAYILYSDPEALNRWGFLYVQFKAECYYWIIPMLGYILVKGMFIAFAQKSGVVQAIALVLIDGAYLVAVCFMKPWMDRKTNIFNISITVVNFFNSVLLLIFSGVFHEPGLVSGVCGVVFFVLNAIFALVLLILVLIASVYALVSRDPDVRYQPMRDDRASFIKSNSQMVSSTELDALGVTARGDPKTGYTPRDLDADSVSETSAKRQEYAANQPLPASAATSQYAGSQYAGSQRDFDQRSQAPSAYGRAGGGPAYDRLGATSPSPSTQASRSPTHAPHGYPDFRPSSRGNPNYQGQQQGQGANRWQVGAGYDH